MNMSTEIAVMEQNNENIVLFTPFVSNESKQFVAETLNSRWIGQGPRVDELEETWADTFALTGRAVAVNSGTAALQLAYELCDLGNDDEVICPLFTCTATNIPLVQAGCKLKFYDVAAENLNGNFETITSKVTDRTKAIVIVHYGGAIIDLDKLSSFCHDKGIFLIQDAAHAIGATFQGYDISEYGDYTMYSLQAIKTLTAGDGGILVLSKNNIGKLDEAKRRRWFGIDRKKKQGGIWENDIVELGHKWQMTDISAAIALGNLLHLKNLLKIRRENLERYADGLQNIVQIKNISGYNQQVRFEHGAWLQTIIAPDRRNLQTFLESHGVETNQVHYRNDRYTIFSNYSVGGFKNMDRIEEQYLVLPSHHIVTVQQIDKICSLISDYYS